MEDLIALRNEQDEKWGWKDPRMCLTADCWMPHLKTQHVRYVNVKRKVVDIADSLIRRGERLSWIRATELKQTFADLAREHQVRIDNFISRHKIKSIHECHFEELVTNPVSSVLALGLFVETTNTRELKAAVNIVRRRDESS